MKKELRRNEPAEKGENNDSNLRDESALQPGISTVSNSTYDDDNEELTETAADDFREEKNLDKNADPTFDEVDNE
jgi:hypothetical protein